MKKIILELFKKWGIRLVLREIVDILRDSDDKNEQKLGKNIKEALKEYEDSLTLESGDIVRNVVTERVEVVRHSSVEMHKSHYFIKIK